MRANLSPFGVLIFLFSFTEQATSQQDVCPPWFTPDNRSSTGCSCQPVVSKVYCGSDFPLLHLGFCMTYNSTCKTTEFGPCPYVGHYNFTTTFNDVWYLKLPSNASLLNDFMCGPLNREGTLCGKCKDGYGIALYSYTLECSKCWEHGYGWVLYYFLELFPITVMYFLVIIFHIRATSTPLSALVFMSQIVVYTIRLNIPLHMYIENEVTGFPYVALQVLLVMCGIWSLDFFRSVIPPFCVSSNIKAVHAIALEYLVAFYPIFLIFITYVCIKLHDNNFRPVVWLWKPFHRHFVYFRRRWDPKASIINAFTTFLLLSFSKVLFVSFTLLYTFHIDYNFDFPESCVLYYEPTVKCHALDFIIFAAIAGCVLVVFIFSPTILLILYPTRLFRKCISCCRFRRWHALYMFMESFQGQYKDGTNGTRDFRMVSASFFILQILIVATFLNRNYFTQTPACQIAMLASVSCFYAIARPHKSNSMNTVDILILFLVEMLSLVTINSSPRHFTFAILISTLLLGVPHMVLIFYICHIFTRKTGIIQYMRGRYKTFVQVIKHTGTNVEDESCIDSLPDRLLNPEEYEPLLPTTEEHTAADCVNKEAVNEEPRRLIPVYTYSSFS